MSGSAPPAASQRRSVASDRGSARQLAPPPQRWSGGLGDSAGVATGVVRAGLDRRLGQRVRRVGQQLARIVGHRLVRVDDRVRLWRWRDHADSEAAATRASTPATPPNRRSARPRSAVHPSGGYGGTLSATTAFRSRTPRGGPTVVSWWIWRPVSAFKDRPEEDEGDAHPEPEQVVSVAPPDGPPSPGLPAVGGEPVADGQHHGPEHRQDEGEGEQRPVQQGAGLRLAVGGGSAP